MDCSAFHLQINPVPQKICFIAFIVPAGGEKKYLHSSTKGFISKFLPFLDASVHDILGCFSFLLTSISLQASLIMEQEKRGRKIENSLLGELQIAFREHYFHKEIYSLRRWIELISSVSLKTFPNLHFQKINNTKESALGNEWYSNYILFYQRKIGFLPRVTRFFTAISPADWLDIVKPIRVMQCLLILGRIMGLWRQTALCTGRTLSWWLNDAWLQLVSVSLCYSDKAMRDFEL